MAEVKVVITGDTHPLEAALAQAKEKAKKLGEGLGEIGSDIAKGLTGFDLSKLLGIGAVIYAATKLGEALIDAAKEGYKAFQQYQEAVLRFKYTLPASSGTPEQRTQKAGEIADMVDEKDGIFSFKQMSDAAQSLMQSSKELASSTPKLGEMLDKVTALAIKTGGDPASIAEGYRKLSIGLKEEGGGAAGKFMKSTPGLEEETLKLRDQDAADYLQSVGGKVGKGSKEEIEYQKRSEINPVEFMTKQADEKGPAAFMEMMNGIIDRSANKNIIKEAEANAPEKMLADAFERINKAFGEQLKPAIDDLFKTITEALPSVRDGFMAMAEVLKLAIPALGFFIKAIDAIVVTISTAMQGINGKLADWLGINKTKADVQAVSDQVDKTLSLGKSGEGVEGDSASKWTKGMGIKTANYTSGLYFGQQAEVDPEAEKSKAIREANAQLEAANTSAKQKEYVLKQGDDTEKVQRDSASGSQTFARHSAMEEQSSQYHLQARSASMLASAVPGGDMAAGKIIELNEAAQQKKLANDLAAADKIAKIEDEKANRAAARKDEDSVGLKSEAEKDARNAKRAAENDASAAQIADIQAEAAQKNRQADRSAAEQIIEAKLAAANEAAETEYNATIKAIDSRKGPEHDEGPQGEETYSKWGKGGTVIEGSFERKRREKANKKLDDDFKAQQDADKKAAEEQEKAEKKAATKQAASDMAEISNVNALSAYSATPEGQAAIKAGHPGLPAGKELSPLAQKDPNAGTVEWLKTVVTWLTKISTTDESLLKVFTVS